MFARVLIIDDCGVTTYFLRTSLKEYDFDTQSTGSGEEGLAMAEQYVPDAVIVDRRLPGMAGEEVCRRLRASETTRHASILMLTSTSDERVRREVLEIGADDFIVKPVRPKDIAERLERHITNRRALKHKTETNPVATADLTATNGQISPTLHAFLTKTLQSLTGDLELVHLSDTLSLKDRSRVESTLDQARRLRLVVEHAEVLPFEALDLV